MKRLISILICSISLLSACADFLDNVPEEDMTTLNSIFETREQAEEWLRSCYVFMQDPTTNLMSNEAYLGADELVCGSYMRATLPSQQEVFDFPGLSIATGLQNTLNPYSDLWVNLIHQDMGRQDLYTAINLCNVFIEHIDQVYNMEDYEKEQWKAEVKAVKAYYYFELVRRYGPIILMPHSLDPNIPTADMQLPRSHVDSCFSAIVKLCDEAANELLPLNQKETSRRAYFSKESAMALKARTLLYQASPLFNGNSDYANFTNKNGEPLFNTTYDPEKWRMAAEAAEAAIETCRNGGIELINDRTANTELQKYMQNIEYTVYTAGFSNKEAILLVKGKEQLFEQYNFYYYTLPLITDGDPDLKKGTCLSPSLKMVEMFYSDKGLPIDQDPYFDAGKYTLTRETDPKYTDVVMLNEDIPLLHTHREPRFYAMIAADRCFWRMGSKASDNYGVYAYKGESFGEKLKLINPQAPQNLTGYWLKKWTFSAIDLPNYFNNIGALGERPIPVIRLAELYLIAAEAWNEYGDQGKAFLNLNEVRRRAGIPDVEVSWREAKDPGKINTVAGRRDIIQQEWNIEFAFEGVRYWNLRRWKTAHIEMNEKLYGWNIFGTDNRSFYNNGQPVVVFSDNKFVAPRDYLYPIKSEEITKSGCVQNPGW